MRNGKLLFSVIEFLIILALFITGITFFILHYSVSARQFLVKWILEGEVFFLSIAILTLTATCVLSICFGIMQKGSFIRFKGKGFSVDESIVRNSIITFWRERFPKEPLHSEVYCSKGKIEIITSDFQEDFDEMEVKLGLFLSRQLGYNRDFYITLSQR